jgi:hypothetical protein
MIDAHCGLLSAPQIRAIPKLDDVGRCGPVERPWNSNNARHQVGHEGAVRRLGLHRDAATDARLVEGDRETAGVTFNR